MGGLGGQGPVDSLLEGKGEDGGDPRVARGAHLAQVFMETIIKVCQKREREVFCPFHYSYVSLFWSSTS